MNNVISIINSEELDELGALMVDLPQNSDGLKVLVIRFEGKVSAWINSCPHDGRPLCRDPIFLWEKKRKLLQCMNHQALFNANTGICEEGPCKGESLTGLITKEKNNQIIISRGE
ncbi:Rieske (2Fe-2S) protein [Paracoccaceae bacterium]|nr:Rieske (2Fe-2S) protein [Paracoccaceae bacterium]